MTTTELLHHRLANQQISGHAFTTPQALIAAMGCLQAQDFAAAKWAIGNRITGITESTIEKDFNEGKILRTHVLRPTWHFVAPADIGWMLKLTAPQIKTFTKSLHRKFGIDDAILKRSKNSITKALDGGRQLTRAQLLLVLKKETINTDDIRFNLLLMDAELDGIICSGGRQGKQFTYALLEERVPKMPYPGNDAAIAALAHRYFSGRGPATLRDFAWWSGLNLSNAKKGIEVNRALLASEIIDGETYWFLPGMSLSHKPRKSVYLLPAFDEYTIAYKDRVSVLPALHHKQAGNGIFKPAIIINGKIAGTWKRTELKDRLLLEASLFADPGKTDHRLITAAAERYATFTGKTLARVDITP